MLCILIPLLATTAPRANTTASGTSPPPQIEESVRLLLNTTLKLLDEMKFLYPPLRLLKYIPPSAVELVARKTNDAIPTLKDLSVKLAEKGVESVVSLNIMLKELGWTVLNLTKQFNKKSKNPDFIAETRKNIDQVDYAFAAEHADFLKQLAEMVAQSANSTKEILTKNLPEVVQKDIPEIFSRGVDAFRDILDPVAETFKSLDKEIREYCQQEGNQQTDEAAEHTGDSPTFRDAVDGLAVVGRFAAQTGWRTARLAFRGATRVASMLFSTPGEQSTQTKDEK